MPQIFQVLRCYKCLVFQVHQTKKSNKWECKLCGEKQSLKRHYGIGTGKDSRIHVQKLNGMRGEIDELNCGHMQKSEDSNSENETEQLQLEEVITQQNISTGSKWSNFVEDPEPLKENTREPMCFGNSEVVLEIPKKRSKRNYDYPKRNYYTARCSALNNATESIINLKEEPLRINTSVPKSSLNIVTTQATFFNDLVLSDSVSNISSDNLKIEKENSEPSVPHKNFVPPLINKNSKWAQFAEEEEPDVAPVPNMDISQKYLMFSQCGDRDLDDVLDF